MKTWWYRLGALVFGVALLLGSAGSAIAQSAGEQSSVFPEVGTPGGRFTFLASGFKPKERVAVWINTPDGKVSTTGITVEPISFCRIVSWRAIFLSFGVDGRRGLRRRQLGL